MKEIITLSIISGLTFIGFAIALFLGILKKSKKLVIIAVGIFVLFVGIGSWTGYKFFNKSYNTITNMFKPRTGEEIYTALFGKPKYKCLKIINYTDQVAPKIDYAIWLHFKTCPDELKRILSLSKFTRELRSTKTWMDDFTPRKDWFKPETMGDSVVVYKNSKDGSRNGQTIYTSLDSTKVFCVDIAD